MDRSRVITIASITTAVILVGIGMVLIKAGKYVTDGKVGCVAATITPSPKHQPQALSVKLRCGKDDQRWLTTEPIAQGDPVSCVREHFVSRVRPRLVAPKVRYRKCAKAVA